jgi:hypothetical protein
LGGRLAVFVRYRRAGAAARTQIRWLLYACGRFGLVFVSDGFLPPEMVAGEGTLVGLILELTYRLTIVAIPAALVSEGLHYRWWDNVVLIRRTLI